MSIPDVSNKQLRQILAENLTPSDSIKTPERLFGREKTLTTIDRAFNSPGRQIFIFGDRGVGKTSLALTAAYLHTGVENAPIYVMCGKTNNFGQIIQTIGNAIISGKAGATSFRWRIQLNISGRYWRCGLFWW
jgi:Cdc6-like AAA superfamily ATPase